MSFLFSKKPKVAKPVTTIPVEKVQQTNIADDAVRRQYAKMRKATMLREWSGVPKEQLGR